MIVVRVEVWPGGSKERARSLGHMVIANDTTGTKTAGNYLCRIMTWHKKPRIWKEASVSDFPRRRLGPWDLLYRALRDAVGTRNGALAEEE
jgi:hypothetical protein